MRHHHNSTRSPASARISARIRLITSSSAFEPLDRWQAIGEGNKAIVSAKDRPVPGVDQRFASTLAVGQRHLRAGAHPWRLRRPTDGKQRQTSRHPALRWLGMARPPEHRAPQVVISTIERRQLSYRRRMQVLLFRRPQCAARSRPVTPDRCSHRLWPEAHARSIRSSAAVHRDDCRRNQATACAEQFCETRGSYHRGGAVTDNRRRHSRENSNITVHATGTRAEIRWSAWCGRRIGQRQAQAIARQIVISADNGSIHANGPSTRPRRRPVMVGELRDLGAAADRAGADGQQRRHLGRRHELAG